MSAPDVERGIGAWLRSARTKIVFASAVSIGLLIALFGIFVHFAVVHTLMSTVDSELENRIRPSLDHPPPPRRFDDQGFSPQNFAGNPGQGFPGGQPQLNGLQNEPGQNAAAVNPPGRFNPGQNMPEFSGQGGPPPDELSNLYRPRRFFADLTPAFEPGPRGIRVAGQAAWSSMDLQKASASDSPIFTSQTLGGIHLRILTKRIPSQGQWPGHGPALVQAVYPLADIDRAQAGVDTALLWLVPIGVLVSIFGGIASTSSVFKRVGNMAESAQSMSVENFGRTLPVSGSDEFAQLAISFNGLLGRLKEAFDTQNKLIERQRRFTADASHELKTPLTIIRGTTSLALSTAPFEPLCREEVEDIDRASVAMSTLVQDLLTLARYDDGHVAARNRINVGNVITRALTDVSVVVRNRCQFRMPDSDVFCVSDEIELARVFVNLIVNGSKAIGKGEGTIFITLSQAANIARVEIRDTGVGIDPRHLPNLFDRFYRVDDARSDSGQKSGGTGLGLAICKSIVESMNGTISITSPGLGKGASVVVELPVG